MRLGIFSDVHANLEALQAVVTAFATADIERYVCLGDIVGYGANPNECCRLIRELADIVILGNHDAACCGRMDASSFNAAARIAVERHRHMIESTYHTWLRELPYAFEQDDLLFCHGSPFQAEQFYYILDEGDVEIVMHAVSRRPLLLFIGHTHRGTTFVAQETSQLHIWEDGRETITVVPRDSYIFNVGSVGQPRDRDWRASYAIFDTVTKVFERRRVEYDVDTASDKIQRLGLPVMLSERLHLGV
jgi:diadenosine tetraphosphatase ApaH/serine/threonine PP2A family protein phosphatase